MSDEQNHVLVRKWTQYLDEEDGWLVFEVKGYMFEYKPHHTAVQDPTLEFWIVENDPWGEKAYDPEHFYDTAGQAKAAAEQDRRAAVSAAERLVKMAQETLEKAKKNAEGEILVCPLEER